MANNSPIFKDFIPEGTDPGAQGRGFQDWVPGPEPEKPQKPVDPKGETEPVDPTTPVEETVAEQPKKEKGKKA